MNSIALCSIITIIIFAFCFKKVFAKTKSDYIFIWILFFGAVIRILCGALYAGHNTDMNCFSAWSDMLFKDGFSKFYTSDSFTDYPPGYMYILWIVGFIKNTFSMSEAGKCLVIKLPAIIADILTAIVLYSYTKKKHNEKLPLLSAILVFNPAIILNSSLWGQVDSIMTLFMVLAIILLCEKQFLKSYFIFAIALFIKPQALIFTPIFMYALYEELRDNFSIKKLIKHIIYVLCAFLVLLILAFPFGINEVFMQYIKTLESYPYATVNAFNLWGALGKNWSELTPFVSFMGTLFILLIVFASFHIMKKNKTETRYFYTAAFLSFATFVLSTKMHERYAFPTMIFILFAFAENKSIKRYVLYCALSVSQLINTAYILFIYSLDPGLYFRTSEVSVFSFLNVLILFLWIFFEFKNVKLPNLFSQIENKKETFRITRKDIVLIVVITICYGVVAFSALGDKKSPESEYVITPENEVILEFDESRSFYSSRLFLGASPLDENSALRYMMYDENLNLVLEFSQKEASVFTWKDFSLENQNAKYIKLSSTNKIVIKEICFIDEAGNILIPENASLYYGLFDEIDTIPDFYGYENSMYFDEIYHARTAYEFIEKLPVYEWTHPPLGKILIAIGIKLFGMNPFGWRFMGTLFGVLMIPILYSFAKFLLRKRWITAIATILFSVDFMHYTQTRIATIDVYVTFFIMLMYLFMAVYIECDFYGKNIKKRLVPLGLSGIFMGFAIASKWTGLYAASGLAVIFFVDLFLKFKESKNSQTMKKEFSQKALKTVFFCLLFFVIIPIGIYMLSYIPYLRANGEGILGIWKNQVDILTYHGKTVVESTHPYSSESYSWPLILRPIWYYSNSFVNGEKAGISAFGNPAVWWSGLLAVIVSFGYIIKNKDKTASFLMIGYLSNYLPWFLIKRTMFIYHYFPSVPFMVIMTGYVILRIFEKNKNAKKWAYILTVVAIILFIVFYPVLSGMPINPGYANILRWLPGWVLI